MVSAKGSGEGGGGKAVESISRVVTSVVVKVLQWDFYQSSEWIMKCDSLGGFHRRIAAFDAGCANATAGQDGLLHGFGYQ